MAALLVLLVFLLCVILTVPIGVSMVMGAAAPILLLDKGGSIAQVLNNTFSGANSTPHIGRSAVYTGRRDNG